MSYQSSQLVGEYIAQFSGTTKERLTWLRQAIQTTFPKTIEDMSYGMPAYRPAPKKRGVIFFAAAKDHIGIYGVFEPDNNKDIHKIMEAHRTGKGTLQFSNSQPLPKQVINEILAYHYTKIA